MKSPRLEKGFAEAFRWGLPILAMTYVLLVQACEPSRYFKSPNEVYKQNVSLVFKDHRSVHGLITIDFEFISNAHEWHNDYILFRPEGKQLEDKIDLKMILGYYLDSSYYALKAVDYLMNNTNHLLFLKRLTREDSRIQFYELYESGKGNPTGEIRYSYFLSFAGNDANEVINTRSSQLIPNFENKMSRFVADCPALAEKILTNKKVISYPLPRST